MTFEFINREDLVSYLEGVAEEAFYGNCSKDDDGDWISECDANGVVEGVLADYEERLTKLFAPAEEDEETAPLASADSSTGLRRTDET